MRTKISENFNIRPMRWNKIDLSKETKKKRFQEETVYEFSVAVVGRFTVNKVSLNNSPPVYLHVLKQTLSSELKPL